MLLFAKLLPCWPHMPYCFDHCDPIIKNAAKDFDAGVNTAAVMHAASQGAQTEGQSPCCTGSHKSSKAHHALREMLAPSNVVFKLACVTRNMVLLDWSLSV